MLVALAAYFRGHTIFCQGQTCIPAIDMGEFGAYLPRRRYLFPGLGDLLGVYAISTVKFNTGEFNILYIEGGISEMPLFRQQCMHTAILSPDTSNSIYHEIIPTGKRVLRFQQNRRQHFFGVPLESGLSGQG